MTKPSRSNRPTRTRRVSAPRSAQGEASVPATKSNTLTNRLKPKQTPDAAVAEMMVEGLATNAVAVIDYSKALGVLDLTESLAALIAETRKVQAGDLSGLEATLTGQAVTLNAMFTQLAHVASRMTIVDQIDRFTRLALKAQTQCRATAETLAAMKNPPVVFARQANIAQGSQQVNNSLTVARAGTSESEQNKLLEAHGERLDSGTTGAAGSGDRALATVGALNRPKNDRG